MEKELAVEIKEALEDSLSGIVEEMVVNRKGNNRGPNWETILRFSQIAIYPLLCAMFYLVVQIYALDKRMAVLEAGFAKPITDTTLSNKVAIIEDRQIRVISRLEENGARIDKLLVAVIAHDPKLCGVYLNQGVTAK